MKKLKMIILANIVIPFYAFGAYLENVPITITQPNGTQIECLATGDEYYNWLHDEAGYTIVQDKTTGYYCYAILVGDSLVASQYVVGTVSPNSVNLQPYINISEEEIWKKREEIIQAMSQNHVFQNPRVQSNSPVSIGTINNLVVYIRFADQTEFEENQITYTSRFNNISSNTANSMRNYFRKASYNQLDIISHFFPTNDGTTILSYQDSHNRGYYLPYSVTNPLGHDGNRERLARRDTLLYNAVNYIKNQVPTSLNIDQNNDGFVDNISFIVRGSAEALSLWPHAAKLSSVSNLPIQINGKTANFCFLVLEEHSENSTLCHEMGHIFRMNDLSYGFNPAGSWDLMSWPTNPPQHFTAYMKHKYGGWIPSIPVITTSGTYTLQPLTSVTNNCYQIPIKGSEQYLVVEYRKHTDIFESSLPDSGLIIYRINEDWNGNYYFVNNIEQYGVLVFRPGGGPGITGYPEKAAFSTASGRTEFSNWTDPYGYTAPNGDFANIYIKNIRENADGTMSFDIRFCDGEDVIHSNTNNLPAVTNASNSIQTSGTVVVKSTDNVSFEAGNKIILKPGFKVESGGTFRINMNACGEK
ncbi:MAG: hypothetical protein FWE63_04190 [Bacteroidales bacterium]|nr:hypothetical protein [Bacteroidales bacterium]